MMKFFNKFFGKKESLKGPDLSDPKKQEWVDLATKMIFENSEMHTANVNSRFGGLRNNYSGIGSELDVTSNDYNQGPDFINYQVFDNIYRTNVFARKLINIPAEDMTSKWREFQSPTVDDAHIVEKRTQAEKDYLIDDVFTKAIKYADLYGGSAILIVIDDGKPISEPLDIKRIRKGSLVKLEAVFLGQMTPGEVSPKNWDPASIYFRRPQKFIIGPSSDNILVDQSRLILMDGVNLSLYSSTQQLFFGDSRLTSCIDILNATQSVYLNIANLLAKANIDVVGVKNFAEIAMSFAKGKDEALNGRIRAQQLMGNNLKQIGRAHV